MSSYDDIIAKSKRVSLKDHSLNSLKILEILIESNEELLKNWSKLLNISDLNYFLNNIKKSGFFHDFGKASYKWQSAIKELNDDKRLPPHAIYSGFYLPCNNPDESIPLFSVISHHSLLTEKSFGSNLDYNTKFYDEYLEEIATNQNFNLTSFSSLTEYLNFMRDFKVNSQKSEVRDLYRKKINLLFKARYCLNLSYLTMADGLSSNFEENGIRVNEQDVLDVHPSPKLINNEIGVFSKGLTLNPIQKYVVDAKQSEDIYELTKPMLLEAPCGEGKTLASLLFSEILFKNDLINKVIFVLPTQVTSNNMFFEFNKEYNIPKKWIGIYHSEVLNFLLKTDDEINPYFEKYKNLVYSKPFNVSTIDHLLLSLVNGFKYAPRAFGNMLNSLVIIDELHYYDSHTLALIEVLCEVLRFLKIPHIIMSATIPRFIKNKFDDNEYLKIQSSGCDVNNIEKNPYVFSYHSSEIYNNNNNNNNNEFSEDFLVILKDNIDKNIGIIVNTVHQSKRIYEDIKSIFPDTQVLLYNARFMKKDRPIKEKLIKSFSNILYKNCYQEDIDLLLSYGFDPDKNFIFIGTQVAEISLNMSFDVMISELAPLDAIIQRGGRLHRKMTFNNSEKCDCIQCQRLDKDHKYVLHVFDTGKYCYPYYVEDDKIGDYRFNIINNTRKILSDNPKYTFKKSVMLMDEVYDKNSFNEDNSIKISFRNKICEDLIFGVSPSSSEEKGGQLRIQTRNIPIQTIPVLPLCFLYNEEYVLACDFIKSIYKKFNYNDKFTQKGLNKILECLISVSTKFYFSNNGKHYSIGGYSFNIIDLNYTFEKGLFKEDECCL